MSIGKLKREQEETVKIERKTSAKPILFEIAWEVCNQVGGIYTVIRSKVPAMVEEWGDNYCLIGPYFAQTAGIEFERLDNDDSIFSKAAQGLRDKGMEVYYGRWLVTGKPRIILIDFNANLAKVDMLKFELWERHKISTINCEDLVNRVIAFGDLVKQYLQSFVEDHSKKQEVIAHFHEWMASTALIDLRKDKVNIGTVFTTHATMLGRYIAGNVNDFYEKLHRYDWEKEAKNYGIEAQAGIERQSAQLCHVLTTVSDVTAKECEVFFGRICDLILPNGLNITRFAATHEFQNLHLKYKQKINQFVMGHFFQSYSWDLDNTLYFFTSGRYEFKNKGYDLTLEALKRLNFKIVQSGLDMTVVMFMITKNPVHSIDPQVLQSRAVMEEIRQTCESMEKEIGEHLFHASASNEDANLPDLNEFVSEYWRLRLRRTIQTWRTKTLPRTVTHLLKEPDDITDFFEKTNLMNHQQDRVKFVYHPDFISPTNPLFGLEYSQFVRGCHLGVFPSYYEPWGYTPLECVVRGIPTVTSDLSGFGDFMMQLMDDYENVGVYVVNRKDQNFDKAADQLANIMFKFVTMTRRDRIMQRNRVENISDVFDWTNLRAYYDTAHDLALKKKGLGKS
ncbi:glycogen synthase [Lacihabitans sp. CS3-21]|jgi:glycogen(starch) synthase|uniref:glycogen synthase n=1 Tax=Lacihabitans sp. CS3-21 TaxID=2487332 RepID=UPI000BC50122|nr:glycogen synthase [Lacihabitans sp. CS3-21]MCP9745724.1 glycogen synthase [Lacihabitans sp. CS3-21]MDP1814058.1 glycogen synthase [Leadbetterella sp.]OYU67161.1 MAG: glycogen synthase [Cytophagaceae bacterium BCCC1]